MAELVVVNGEVPLPNAKKAANAATQAGRDSTAQTSVASNSKTKGREKTSVTRQTVPRRGRSAAAAKSVGTSTAATKHEVIVVAGKNQDKMSTGGIGLTATSVAPRRRVRKATTTKADDGVAAAENAVITFGASADVDLPLTKKVRATKSDEAVPTAKKTKKSGWSEATATATTKRKGASAVKRTKASTVAKTSRKKSATATKSRTASKKIEVWNEKSVNDMLKVHGVKKINKVSKCLRAGILEQHVKLLPPKEDPEGEFGLDQVLLEGDCILCDESVTCTVRDVLYQADYGGDCYETGGETTTLHCPTEECPGLYVGGICYGEPFLDSGKFHNHCTDCPDFGCCIGDYREVHCHDCGNHYHGRFGMGGCYNCYSDSDGSEDSEEF